MATNGGASSEAPDERSETSLLSRLSDDFLQCPMCRQRYREPRLLTCLHAVCSDCLEELRASALDRQRFKLSFVSVECPVCCRLTDVTPGVGRLPSDSVRARLLEVVSVAEASNVPAAGGGLCCEMCSHSGRARPATGRCLDCGKRLCPACRQRHHKVRVTSDHEMVDLDRQTALNCDRHPSELVRFYCTSCQMPVCIGCTFSNAHSAHVVLKFKDAAQQKATELSEYSRLCSEKLEQLGAALHLARTMEAHVTATEAAIREAAAQHASAIRAAQKALLDELKEFYDCYADLLARRHDIAAALRDLTEVSSFTELVQSRKYSESLLLAPRVSIALARCAEFQPPEVPVGMRRYRLIFAPEQPTLGRLEKQKLTDSYTGSNDSIGSSDSHNSGSSIDVSSLGLDDPASFATPERSFFTYDNSTLRSSVCRSLTTDTLVSPVADAECQTDFCLVVNLGFALFSLHVCLEDPEPLLTLATEAEQPDLTHLASCSQLTAIVIESCSFFDPQTCLYVTAQRSSEVRVPLLTGLCTMQTCLQALETSVPQRQSLSPPSALLQLPSAPRKRGATDSPFEVRVCSVMFSSMESNDSDNLELVRPTLLKDASCQTPKLAPPPPLPPPLPSPPIFSTVSTQTPHLPTRCDLAATGIQTISLALFSRDAQAQPDTEERGSQTRARVDQRLARIDKATQWESEPCGHSGGQRLYRSGRIVRVVGTGAGAGTMTSSAASVCERLALSPRSPRRLDTSKEALAFDAASSEASEPQLYRLTECLSQKVAVEFQPVPTPPRAVTNGTAAAMPGPSSHVGGSRPTPAGVKFPKPKSEESSLDRLKNFCARLRQRRSGLGKQRIEVLKDKSLKDS